MIQTKIFQTPMGASVLETKINGWLEEMQGDPTFRLIDISMSSYYNGNYVATNQALVIYSIESEKEKEARTRAALKLLEAQTDARIKLADHILEVMNAEKEKKDVRNIQET